MNSRAAAASLKFPRTARILSRAEFLRVQNEGRKISSKHFLIIVRPGEREHSRFGVTVTTKIDKRAVVRNKIKRRARELFRSVRARMSGSFDIVIIARNNAQACSYGEMCREITDLLIRNGFLRKE